MVVNSPGARNAIEMTGGARAVKLAKAKPAKAAKAKPAKAKPAKAKPAAAAAAAAAAVKVSMTEALERRRRSRRGKVRCQVCKTTRQGTKKQKGVNPRKGAVCYNCRQGKSAREKLWKTSLTAAKKSFGDEGKGWLLSHKKVQQVAVKNYNKNKAAAEEADAKSARLCYPKPFESGTRRQCYRRGSRSAQAVGLKRKSREFSCGYRSGKNRAKGQSRCTRRVPHSKQEIKLADKYCTRVKGARRKIRGKWVQSYGCKYTAPSRDGNGWTRAVSKARTELGITGFQPIKKGSALYKKAKQIFAKQGSAVGA